MIHGGRRLTKRATPDFVTDRGRNSKGGKKNIMRAPYSFCQMCSYIIDDK